MMPRESRLSASFRDPSGYLFRRDDLIFRQINQVYREDYDHLMSSGLFQKLVASQALISHKEVDIAPHDSSQVYKVIQPEQIPFISYPYEWSFSALRDAALTTLWIQEVALDHGMILKDASAYNIQFHKGKPILIDTLSFQHWVDGRPWEGYRQFCQHFLAPLALMTFRDHRVSKLLISNIDGIPLDLASKLLPRKTYLRPALLTHIHLHSKFQERATRVEKAPGSEQRTVSLNSIKGLTQSLKAAISALKWKSSQTPWGDYYDTFSYDHETVEHKESLVHDFINMAKPEVVWDLGANTGRFSRVAMKHGAYTIAMDIDPSAVEQNYQEMATKEETSILPLIMDLTNPSPGLGWRSRERDGLIERGPVDAILALALVHHLAIGNNIPLPEIAEFFADLCEWLLIEFIPKEDVQVQRMLSVRRDIFDDYSEVEFEKSFSGYFKLVEKTPLDNSTRTMYTLQKLPDGKKSLS